MQKNEVLLSEIMVELRRSSELFFLQNYKRIIPTGLVRSMEFIGKTPKESHVCNKRQRRKRELPMEFNVHDENQVSMKECAE
jgi:hypothetical protein